MMANRIRRRMDELGLTNQILADRAGMPTVTVNRIVSGQTENPSIQTLIGLAAVLEMSLDEMCGLAMQSEAPIKPSPAISAYENMVQVVQQLHNEQLRDLQAHHAADLIRLDEQHKSSIRELNETHQRQIDSLEREHETALVRMERQYEKTIQAKDLLINRQFVFRVLLVIATIISVIWAISIDLRTPDVGFFRF